MGQEATSEGRWEERITVVVVDRGATGDEGEMATVQTDSIRFAARSRFGVEEDTEEERIQLGEVECRENQGGARE